MKDNLSIVLDGEQIALENKDDLLKHTPKSPGVYLIYDEFELLYVGKSKNLHSRLSQYRNAGRKKKERKMRMLFQSMAHIELQCCDSEKAALLLENQLIQEHQPSHNIAGAYYFLYPYLGFKWHQGDKNWLIFACSSDQGALDAEGFINFGCFRSRHLCREAHHSLSFLLGLLGHEDRNLSKEYLQDSFSRRSAFRQVPRDLDAPFKSFLQGESLELLPAIAEHLLEKPGARQKSQEVQQNLRFLRRFFRLELEALRLVLKSQGIQSHSIEQELRDQLMIQERF